MAQPSSRNPQIPPEHPPKDLKGLQKYRIGDYRILLWVDHKERQITLYGVEHRRSVYDDLSIKDPGSVERLYVIRRSFYLRSSGALISPVWAIHDMRHDVLRPSFTHDAPRIHRTNFTEED